MTQPRDNSSDRHQTVLICLALALAVLAAYGRLWDCDFVDLDDGDYVIANNMVRQGVSRAGIVWAFTTVQAGIWHPLTWISYLVDYQIYGMNPAGYHFTNLLLHLANSLLLFLLLRRMTKARWPSALAAALFALHPMHVESVAWISERKDVLSTLFWMLTVWAYARYVEEFNRAGRKAGGYYIGSVVLFAVGLMAKPMLVTLPFVLLLLDYWPLRRAQPLFRARLVEKTPFFILAAASSVVTFRVARQVGAVASIRETPFGPCVANALVSYARYIGKTFWPSDLAVFYPYQMHWPAWAIAGSAALLALVTGLVLWRMGARPYLAVGWFWFLGMLVPVIGLIPDGSFAMADRFSYLSNVGLFIMVIWGMREGCGRLGLRAAVCLGLLAVSACLAATVLQVRYWKNSVTLFARAAETTERNPFVQCGLGGALYEEGRMEEAMGHLRQALDMAPDFAQAHYVMGNVLLRLDRVDEAILHFQTALRIRPDSADYHRQMGRALGRARRMAEAVREYESVLQIRPDDIQAAGYLAWVLASYPDPSLRDGPRAVQLAARANRLSGGQDPDILGTLAVAYAEVGKFPDAIATARLALQRVGPAAHSPMADALRAQIVLYQSGLPFRDTGPARPNTPPSSP